MTLIYLQQIVNIVGFNNCHGHDGHPFRFIYDRRRWTRSQSVHLNISLSLIGCYHTSISPSSLSSPPPSLSSSPHSLPPKKIYSYTHFARASFGSHVMIANALKWKRYGMTTLCFRKMWMIGINLKFISATKYCEHLNNGFKTKISKYCILGILLKSLGAFTERHQLIT